MSEEEVEAALDEVEAVGGETLGRFVGGEMIRLEKRNARMNQEQRAAVFRSYRREAFGVVRAHPPMRRPTARPA